MKTAIERPSIGRYGAPMTLFVRLLALLAMVLMPFGMAAAPAAPVESHHSSAASGIEHCPDESSKNDLAGGPGGCAMPCSAALPASDLPAPSLPYARYSGESPIAVILAGIELEIATPPPKHS